VKESIRQTAFYMTNRIYSMCESASTILDISMLSDKLSWFTVDKWCSDFNRPMKRRRDMCENQFRCICNYNANRLCWPNDSHSNY